MAKNKTAATLEANYQCKEGFITVACENIRFSSLFAAGDSYEERGETDVFAGYYYSIDLSLQRQLLLQIKFNLSMDKQSSVAQSTRY